MRIITKTTLKSIVTRLARVTSRRVTGSIFLKDSSELIAGLPGTAAELLHGLVGDMTQDCLPGEMVKAKGHSTEHDAVINLRISAESFAQDFSRFYPALSTFLVSVHSDEILWRIKREGRPETLWTPKMDALAERLGSVSDRWLETASRKVRGKTAQTLWLLEVSRVLAEANWICVEILTAIIEAGVEGEPW
jgi:hypothetical protein